MLPNSHSAAVPRCTSPAVLRHPRRAGGQRPHVRLPGRLGRTRRAGPGHRPGLLVIRPRRHGPISSAGGLTTSRLPTRWPSPSTPRHRCGPGPAATAFRHPADPAPAWPAAAQLGPVRSSVIMVPSAATPTMSRLRAAGASQQVSVLADRLPAAGLFDIFNQYSGSRFRFGRKQDGRQAQPGDWGRSGRTDFEV